MELQKQDKELERIKSELSKKISETELSKAIKAADFKKASSLLPKRIEGAFDQPKVNELVRALGSEEPIKRMIEFELIELANLMSVGGNLNRAQVPFIAEQLIMLYPNESIADFKLCFQRGAIGLYGDIQRLDGVTIGQWMKAYLDEKYEVLEIQLMKEKDNPYKLFEKAKDLPPEELSEDDPEYHWHDAWLENLARTANPINKIPEMTDEYLKKYGREKPVKVAHTAGYTYFNVRGVEIFASTRQHAEEIVEVALKNGLLEEDI